MNSELDSGGPTPNLVIIGASTGGPRVLYEILSLLPPLNASVLIVQHVPKFINASLVRSLGLKTKSEVRLAQTGDAMAKGVFFVAPSEIHCVIDAQLRLRLIPGPRVNYVCPSIDVTMQSISPQAKVSKLVGVLLTGMGRDGVEGLAHIKQMGGLTIAQEQSTCAVYGMPGEAVKRGCVDLELNPSGIAALLGQQLKRRAF